jgi:fido (protein-threonine AMPylation protein)
MADDPYVYPGTGVLRNNLEIRDPQELSQAEADIAWEHLDHEQSLAANVRSLNGRSDQLRALLEAIVDMTER